MACFEATNLALGRLRHRGGRSCGEGSSAAATSAAALSAGGATASVIGGDDAMGMTDIVHGEHPACLPICLQVVTIGCSPCIRLFTTLARL